MKSYFIVIIGVSTFFMGLFACSKKEQLHPVYVDAALAKYFDYQPGSYWVFYDSLNNNMDSMYVFSADTLPPYIDPGNPNEEIRINMGLDSSISFTLNLAANQSFLFVKYYHPNKSVDGIEYPNVFTNNIPFDTGSKLINGAYYNGYYQNTFIQDEKIGLTNYSNINDIAFNFSPTLSDNFRINAPNGFLSISLNNQYAQRRLYLVSSKIIK